MGSNNQSNDDVNLPGDILIDILSWLPAKSLLRFRSVSKSFKNLIDQPLFISIHQSKSFSNLLIHYTDISIPAKNVLLFNDTLSSSQNLNLSSDILHSRNSAPCNGIFAISNHQQRIGLWNLATKQFRSLPIPNRPKSIPSSSDHFAVECLLGFGYDSNFNDYKVVLYRYYREYYSENRLPQLLVYSLSTNSWRDIDMEILNSIHNNDEQGRVYADRWLYFNGVYYWFLRIGNSWPKSILTFNFNDDKFREVALPDPSPGLSCPAFAVCGGCLAFIGCYGVEVTKVRVWVMVDNECWVQKFEIGPFEGIKRPLNLWKNDYVLLETIDHKLVLGDSFGQLREIHPFETEFCVLIETFVYGESLVSVKGDGDHSNCSNEEDSLADFLSTFV